MPPKGKKAATKPPAAKPSAKKAPVEPHCGKKSMPSLNPQAEEERLAAAQAARDLAAREAKLGSRLNPSLTAAVVPLPGVGAPAAGTAVNRRLGALKPNFAPPQPRDYTFAGDDIGEEDEADAAPKKAASPRERRSRAEGAKTGPQFDVAQLFQSLCLSVRLEVANRRPRGGGGGATKLSAMRVALDEGFLGRMEMMHPGELICLPHLVRLGELLPSFIKVYLPGSVEEEVSATAAPSTPGCTSASPNDFYRVRLLIDSVPSIDDVNQWLSDEEANTVTEGVTMQRGKRDRDDSSQKQGEARPVVGTLVGKTVDTADHVKKSTAEQLLQQEQHRHSVEKQKPPPLLTPRGLGSSAIHNNDDGPILLSKFLSEERMASALEGKKTLEEAEQERLIHQSQLDLDRVLHLYDLVLSIVGLSRRCYAIAKLEVELVGRTRHHRSFDVASGGQASSRPEEIARQLRLLMSFPDAAMSEMQPMRLMFGGDCVDSESDDTPLLSGGGGTSEDSASVSAGPGLLILDSTKTNRLRLSAAVERKKTELGAVGDV